MNTGSSFLQAILHPHRTRSLQQPAAGCKVVHVGMYDPLTVDPAVTDVMESSRTILGLEDTFQTQSPWAQVLALASEPLSLSSPWPRLACPRMSLYCIQYRTSTIILVALQLFGCCQKSTSRQEQFSNMKKLVKSDSEWNKLLPLFGFCFLCLPPQHRWNVS